MIMMARSVTSEIAMPSLPDATEQFNEISQALYNATATCNNALKKHVFLKDVNLEADRCPMQTVGRTNRKR